MVRPRGASPSSTAVLAARDTATGVAIQAPGMVVLAAVVVWDPTISPDAAEGEDTVEAREAYGAGIQPVGEVDPIITEVTSPILRE